MLAGPSRRASASVACTASTTLGNSSRTASARVHTATAPALTYGHSRFDDATNFASVADRDEFIAADARGPSGISPAPTDAISTASATARARRASRAMKEDTPSTRSAFWDWNQVRAADSALFKQELRRAPVQTSSAFQDDPLCKDKGNFENAKEKDRPDLLKQLPQTETDLYRLLVLMGRSKSSQIRPEYMAWFHSRPQFAGVVSNRTYAVVLSNLFRKSSNLKAVDNVLKDMDRREMFTKKDGHEHRVAKALLQGAMLRGHTDSVNTILETMKNRGWGGVNVFNWRRNLGSKMKGKGDREHDWRAGKAVNSQRTLPPLNPLARNRPRLGSATDATLFEDEPMLLSSRLKMASPLIPRNLDTLTKEDVTMLVEALIQRENAGEAFSVTEEWLSLRHEALSRSDQPWTKPDRPAAIDLTHKRFNATASALLNILIKGLVSRRTALPEIKQFVEDFVNRHSLSKEATRSNRNLVPRQPILRTLLTSGRYPRHAWKRAESILRWFYQTFGVPIDQTDKVEPLADALAKKRAQRADAHQVFPADLVDPESAITLLQIAIDNWKCFRPQPDEAASLDPTSSEGRLAIRVRHWWHRLDKTSNDDLDVWSSRRAKKIEAEAIVSGLLDLKPERERFLSSVLKRVRKDQEQKLIVRLGRRAEKEKDARNSSLGRRPRRAVA
ncbi:hypothetical protein OIV83_006092 [Microbotryomycetes sp. JL201]|nr:hypothetical protein OIV83_006092 [Microbotryomycetes sp. JL201]